MPRDATPLAIAVAAAVFAATFFTTTVVDVPLFWFDPARGSWSFGHRPSTVAIDWYGRTLMSALAWVVAWTSTRVFVRKTPSRETVRIAVAWVAVAFVFAAGLYAFALWNRRPAPEPLPSWYEAR
jgi:hypothetical protein